MEKKLTFLRKKYAGKRFQCFKVVDIEHHRRNIILVGVKSFNGDKYSFEEELEDLLVTMDTYFGVNAYSVFKGYIYDI